ncbi:hypothetical protein CI784_09395 [Arthrobacter agilis]|nr:hypothetical protein B8W74_07200 [Arthrobacter agilis]PPB45970.1 hypothetical protein CI784_09395 [Arthrobacter agilis]
MSDDQRYERENAMTEASEGQRAAGESDLGGPSHAAVGPFTLRETVFGGGVALVFIGTLLPFLDGMVRYVNFWNSEPLFFIGIGILLPVIALALLAGRRLGSDGLRVGSLSVDQFASVAAVLATTFFFLSTVTAFHAGPLVALLGALAMLATTVVGPFLPVFRNDFAERPEVVAHAAARPITTARPRPSASTSSPKDEQHPGEAFGSTRDADDSGATDGTGTAAGKLGSGLRARIGAMTGRGSTADDSPSASADYSEPGINPAAAAVRQNGAGLYGAGGAGAVGAGPAASGQSGLERRAAESLGDAESPSDGIDAQGPDREQHASESGSHAVGPDASSERNEQTGDEDQGSPDGVDATRAQDVVRDDPAATRETDAVSGKNRQEPITATRSADEEPVVEAFWFAVGSPRPVFDEDTGRQVFVLQPGDWEVGIEDRGHDFLVQDKRTGAVGILRDLRNIERAPRD